MVRGGSRVKVEASQLPPPVSTLKFNGSMVKQELVGKQSSSLLKVFSIPIGIKDSTQMELLAIKEAMDLSLLTLKKVNYRKRFFEYHQVVDKLQFGFSIFFFFIIGNMTRNATFLASKIKFSCGKKSVSFLMSKDQQIIEMFALFIDNVIRTRY